MYEVDSLNATLPLQPSTIRLLEVQPAIDPSDGIDCELRAWTLGSAPSYKALSCAWKEHQGVDQADEQQGVQREGRLGIANAPPAQSSLTVSPSLALAIRRQRRKYHSIFLWIDAVCINQADDDERVLPRLHLWEASISGRLRLLSGSANAYLKKSLANGSSVNTHKRFSTLTGVFLGQQGITPVVTSKTIALW
jgi:hypothetical protein